MSSRPSYSELVEQMAKSPNDLILKFYFLASVLETHRSQFSEVYLDANHEQSSNRAHEILWHHAQFLFPECKGYKEFSERIDELCKAIDPNNQDEENPASKTNVTFMQAATLGLSAENGKKFIKYKNWFNAVLVLLFSLPFGIALFVLFGSLLEKFNGLDWLGLVPGPLAGLMTLVVLSILIGLPLLASVAVSFYIIRRFRCWLIKRLRK